MTQSTDDPKTWFDTSTREGQEAVGKAYADKGWSAPTWANGESHSDHQAMLVSYLNAKK